jgi:hypothetical protein
MGNSAETWCWVLHTILARLTIWQWPPERSRHRAEKSNRTGRGLVPVAEATGAVLAMNYSELPAIGRQGPLPVLINYEASQCFATKNEMV